MFRKLGIAALVVVAGLIAMNKLDLLGYGRVALKKMKDEARGQIPPEMKIERLRDEIGRLGPDVDKHRGAIAAEQVEIEKLRKNITTARTNLKEREELIRTMRGELKNGTAFVSLSGKKLPKEKVEQTLAGQWDSFKQVESAIKSQEELLQAREDNLELAKQKLAQIKVKKDELEVKVAHLESELRKVRLAQTKADFGIDDSQLSRVVRLFDEIETQVAKERTEMEMQKAEFTEEMVTEAVQLKAKADKAFKEMDDRFGGQMAAERK